MPAHYQPIALLLWFLLGSTSSNEIESAKCGNPDVPVPGLLKEIGQGISMLPGVTNHIFLIKYPATLPGNLTLLYKCIKTARRFPPSSTNPSCSGKWIEDRNCATKPSQVGVSVCKILNIDLILFYHYYMEIVSESHGSKTIIYSAKFQAAKQEYALPMTGVFVKGKTSSSVTLKWCPIQFSKYVIALGKEKVIIDLLVRYGMQGRHGNVTTIIKDVHTFKSVVDITGLQPNQQYWFRLLYQLRLDNSFVIKPREWSAKVEALTLIKELETTVSNLTCKHEGDNELTVTWDTQLSNIKKNESLFMKVMARKYATQFIVPVMQNQNLLSYRIPFMERTSKTKFLVEVRICVVRQKCGQVIAQTLCQNHLLKKKENRVVLLPVICLAALAVLMLFFLLCCCRRHALIERLRTTGLSRGSFHPSQLTVIHAPAECEYNFVKNDNYDNVNDAIV